MDMLRNELKVIGQAMTTNRKLQIAKGLENLLTITAPLERYEGKGHESNWKDMSGQVSKGQWEKTTPQKLKPKP